MTPHDVGRREPYTHPSSQTPGRARPHINCSIQYRHAYIMRHCTIRTIVQARLLGSHAQSFYVCLRQVAMWHRFGSASIESAQIGSIWIVPVSVGSIPTSIDLSKIDAAQVNLALANNDPEWLSVSCGRILQPVWPSLRLCFESLRVVGKDPMGQRCPHHVADRKRSYQWYFTLYLRSRACKSSPYAFMLSSSASQHEVVSFG